MGQAVGQAVGGQQLPAEWVQQLRQAEEGQQLRQAEEGQQLLQAELGEHLLQDECWHHLKIIHFYSPVFNFLSLKVVPRKKEVTRQKNFEWFSNIRRFLCFNWFSKKLNVDISSVIG